MSLLGKSIVRGFGFTLGGVGALKTINAVEKLVAPHKDLNDGVMSWDKQGYKEGDPYTIFTLKEKPLKWYLWPLAIFTLSIPIVGIILGIRQVFMMFHKKYYIHFYNFKWNTYQYSDRRYKSGLREEKVLEPVYVNSVRDYPNKQQKIESIVFLLYSTLFLLYLLSIYIPFIMNQ